ncbi:hypothetical protein [Aureimonas altamirensis]|uniref:hypothetical protein n=1 Tax=Aureimonas altamirensis TaxID=370622 RepID=UPI00057D2BB7|nr:hypothetical protein [Aureimonas altamirensis]
MMHWLLVPLLAMTAAGGAAPPARDSITTAATPLFLNRCETLSDTAWRCAGLPGTDVFVSEEETGRWRVAVGVPEDGSPTFHLPHMLGRTMEWRIAGSRPLAGIVRYRFPRPSGSGTDDLLAVVKAGGVAGPGCLAALVDVAANSAAVELAREAADAVAPRFRCGVDTLEAVGRVSGRTRDELMPALR